MGHPKDHGYLVTSEGFLDVERLLDRIAVLEKALGIPSANLLDNANDGGVVGWLRPVDTHRMVGEPELRMERMSDYTGDGKHPLDKMVAMDEEMEAAELLGWNLIANLRWLANQKDRPERVPCGALTGTFLRQCANMWQKAVDDLEAATAKPDLGKPTGMTYDVTTMRDIYLMPRDVRARFAYALPEFMRRVDEASGFDVHVRSITWTDDGVMSVTQNGGPIPDRPSSFYDITMEMHSDAGGSEGALDGRMVHAPRGARLMFFGKGGTTLLSYVDNQERVVCPAGTARITCEPVPVKEAEPTRAGMAAWVKRWLAGRD